MKPSDIIHNRVNELFKREAETGHVAMYRQGYNDKLITAILEYLDQQSDKPKEL